MLIDDGSASLIVPLPGYSHHPRRRKALEPRAPITILILKHRKDDYTPKDLNSSLGKKSMLQ